MSSIRATHICLVCRHSSLFQNTLKFLDLGRFEDLTMSCENFSKDTRLKFEQQAEQFSKLASDLEKTRSKQDADQKETVFKFKEASEEARNNIHAASDQLISLVDVRESKISDNIKILKKNIGMIGVTLESVEAKQIKCDGLVGANRRLLDARFDDLGGQLAELKEREFNNGRDRENIREEIVEMQNRSDWENNVRKQNIQVTSLSLFWQVEF